MNDKTTQLMMVGVALVILAGLFLAFTPQLMIGRIEMLILMFLFVVAVMVIVVIVSNRQEKDTRTKHKRGLEGQDIYSIMDRLVDDLDEDEITYLQDRLAEREHEHRRELAHSIEAEVEKRSKNLHSQ